MIDGFERLRHYAVVGRDHQHHDVGDLGSAGAHAGERFVAGRVDEHDVAAVLFDAISADMLGDPAGFFIGHMGQPDGVEQRSLAVIDVAHDGDHWSAPHAILVDFGLLDLVRGFLFVADLVGGSSEVARQLLGQLHVQGLIDGGENLLVEEALHHDVALDAEFFRQLLYGDASCDGDLAIDGLRFKACAFRETCRIRPSSGSASRRRSRDPA